MVYPRAMKIQDKCIVVTGAASGIGRALVHRFHAEGARHLVAADINEAGAEETAQAVGGSAMRCDVADEAAVAQLIEDTESRFGPIDLFCSNAGVGAGMDLASPNEDWQISWDVNVMSVAPLEPRPTGPAVTEILLLIVNLPSPMLRTDLRLPNTITRSVDSPPICAPTLPPVMVMNSGLLHAPFSERITATPLPRRAPKIKPALNTLGSTTMPCAFSRTWIGIAAVGSF